jgi:DNA replication and repair protein RecF
VERVHVERLEVRDLRNIRDAAVTLEPGLNVFVGRNAQGKTSLLEAVALLARGRSFRTERVQQLIRRGAPFARATAVTRAAARPQSALQVDVRPEGRTLQVDGSPVGPQAYQGRLEAVVYSTDRLRIVRGAMKERRAYLDRGAAALWPAYRRTLREYEQVVRQRNACLERGGRDLEAWDERLVALGGALRHRRAGYAARLQAALRAGYRPQGETYDVALPEEAAGGSEADQQALLREQVALRRRDEMRARRSLAGPHRDAVGLNIDGVDAAEHASSGQARSLLLALALAALAVYREERGTTAVALLDDLDSELDEARAAQLCHEVAASGQALVTTAHPGWARRLGQGRLFTVDEGRVTAA